MGGPDSWETPREVYDGRYQENTASRVYQHQPSEGSFGGQRDFSGVYEIQEPSYGGGDQSDDYWSQSDPYYGSIDSYTQEIDPYYGSSESYTQESGPYYGSSESYTQESDPYGVSGSPYATDYDAGLSGGGASYSEQSELSWGDLQAPWQATPPYRTADSSRALETPFTRTKDLSVMQPYHGNANTLPGPLLKSEVPDSRVTSYQTDFTAPAYGDQTEVLRRLNQLYRRVRRKKPGYGLSGSRGGVRFPTSEEEQLPTGRPGLSERETFATHQGGGVSTEEWLQYRGDRGDTIQYPVASKQVEHDIITVDNIHAWVEPPPPGPDVFTINVESALNFSGR